VQGGTTVQVRITDSAQIEKAEAKLRTIPQKLSDALFSGSRGIGKRAGRCGKRGNGPGRQGAFYPGRAPCDSHLAKRGNDGRDH
jgi:hypothetical protein